MARQRISKDLVRRRYAEHRASSHTKDEAKLKLADQILEYYGIEG